MKLVVAITGASGSLYAQRLLQLLHDDPRGPHEVHVALSSHAREVAEAEVGKLVIPDSFEVHGDTSMQVPYVSGSARFDAMVIIPCSMGTLGRIAHGYSDSAIVRADGTVASGGDAGSIHRLGAKVQGLDACNGWTFWHFDDGKSLRPIDELRSIIRNDLAKADL